MALGVKKPRLLTSVQKKIAALKLYESRITFAMLLSPSSFLHRRLFDAFKEFDVAEYQAITEREPLTIDGKAEGQENDDTIKQLQQLLIHAVVVNQNNNWIFITQIAFYHKNKAVDDVAFVTKNDEYDDKLLVKMEKQENVGGGSWHELRITFGRYEAIVTRGFSGASIKYDCDVTPFLGVGVPSLLAQDNHFLLFSPATKVPTTSTTRVLRDYQRNQSLNQWCFKSSHFVEKNFHTPMPLLLHGNYEGYVHVASKLVELAASKKITRSEMSSLKEYLGSVKYWEHFGFQVIQEVRR